MHDACATNLFVLTEVEIQVMKNGFSEEVIQQSLDPRHFHLIIYPTEKCNFRCVYCYEKFELGKMKPWLIKAIKKFLKVKTEALDTLSVSWFGGEPLLAKSVIYDICEEIDNLSNKYKFSYSGNMTTNGSLLDIETLSVLSRFRQANFQISIDGSKETHDKTRVDVNGSGTFEKIWKNLLAARQSNLLFSILLRIHITGENHESVLEFLRLYDSELKEDGRFSLHFELIKDLGGKNKNDWKGKLLVDTSKRFIDELYQKYLKKDTYEGQISNYICYASKPNSIQIRSDGSVGKCTVALYDEKNHIGEIMEDGRLTLDNDKYRAWIEGFADLDKAKLACPASAMYSKKSYQNKGQIEVIEVL